MGVSTSGASAMAQSPAIMVSRGLQGSWMKPSNHGRSRASMSMPISAFIKQNRFCKTSTKSDEVPRNFAGIQMIHFNLWQQLFPGAIRDTVDVLPEKVQEKVREHLEKFSLWNRIAKPMKNTPHIKLPELMGNNLSEHFEALGQSQIEGYIDSSRELAAVQLPPIPEAWQNTEGWTRYDPDGTATSVPAPSEQAIVFDVETCVREGHFPTMAIAATSEAWYGWVSRRLAHFHEDTEPYYRTYDGDGILFNSTPGTRELIPLELGCDPNKRRIVVGHNVSYDRARVLEQYNLLPSRMRFIDTMSLHMATSGLSTQQIKAWNLKEKKRKAQIALNHDSNLSISEIPEDGEPEAAMSWVSETSPPSLASCYQLWCGESVSKDARDTFVDGTMEDIYKNFQELMSYCANDVLVTHQVYKKMFQHYEEMFPSSVTFAGMLEVGQPYLPTDERWTSFIQRCQYAYDTLYEEQEEGLCALADQALPMVIDGSWELDPWLRHLDWSFTVPEYTTGRKKKDGNWTKGGKPTLKSDGLEMTYVPAWYKKLFPNLFSADDLELALADRSIGFGDRVVPYLLRLAWKEQNHVGPGNPPTYPLYCHEKLKWGYLVPNEDSAEHEGDGPYPWIAPDGRYHETHQYYKLPSSDGDRGITGSVFSKDLAKYATNGCLVSPYDHFLGIYDVLNASYWNSSRTRIMGQFVVWQSDFTGQMCMQSMSPQRLEGRTAPNHRKYVKPSRATDRPKQKDIGLGVILPQVVPFGTVTRRAVERTWLTAANPSIWSIGSELKSRIRAPTGYKFVGADVDSQELWISAVMGDAEMAKSHGSTALGWMTLQGQKSDRTDMHSKTAEISGITRDQAKILNYARIYGAAEEFAAALLAKFNPGLGVKTAKEKAQDLYASTKGVRKKKLSSERTIFEQWEEGTESGTFNKLEAIASMQTPVTPVLRAQISSGLQPRYFGSQSAQFMRSRTNWAVQSSAVDYLHALIVSMTGLCEQYDINARYCISIHDEIRYIVADEDVDRAAYALHLSNLYVRALFAQSLGLTDLPEGVAFFSAVDIDHVIRKETYLSCVTPSNLIPEPPGESVDIHIIGERVGWDLTKKS